MLAAFCAKAESGEPLTVAGDGSQSRRFVYVEDLAEGVVAGLRPEAANRVYNLAGDEDTTILEIAEAVRDHVADTGHRPHRRAARATSAARRSRASGPQRELGWSARTRFAEGFRRYLGWRRARPERRKVLILTADIGEGHDLPARALARELEEEHPGSEVEIVDGLRVDGPASSPRSSATAPGSRSTGFPALFSRPVLPADRSSRPPAGSRFHFMLPAGRPAACCEEIRSHDPDVIVSTYPGTTAVLGELRLRRRLDVPVVSAITDLAGLRFWAHPGVDLHTITHRESIEEVEEIAGPGSARWARPPTDARVPRAPLDKAEAQAPSTCRRTARSSSSRAAAGASATSSAPSRTALAVAGLHRPRPLRPQRARLARACASSSAPRSACACSASPTG